MQRRPVRFVGLALIFVLLASFWQVTPALALSGVYHNPYGNDDLYSTDRDEH